MSNLLFAKIITINKLIEIESKTMLESKNENY